MSKKSFVYVALLLLGVAGVSLAAETPITVSPGDASRLALVEGRCPTFSWGAIEGARKYELVVYLVSSQSEEARPVLRETLAGSASSWTPSLDRCLERGGQYAWSVRAVGAKAASEWSTASLFQVAGGPSEAEFEAAVGVVRRYLAEDATGSAAESAESSGAASATPVAGPPEGASAGPTPLSMAMGDSALQVNGSPVLTEATLEAGCIGRRWLDQGDGTVLDCNTRLIWLKDASCGTLEFTGVAGTANWSDAQLAAGSLQNGMCGLTDGSMAGAWRVPTIAELCRVGEIIGACPVANYATSLVDNRFVGSPHVSNSSGDGEWTEDDPFVGVWSGSYWSANDAGGGFAWYVELGSGFVGGNPGDSFFFVWPVRSGQ